jgi:hypothetical protein
MESIIKMIAAVAELEPKYYLYICIILGVVFSLFSIILFSQFKQLQRKYQVLTKGSEKRQIGELFEEYFERIDELKSVREDLRGEIDEVKALAAAGLHHIGIVRYSAYEEVGGDLSFSLALLDGDYSGVLVTSIFGRDESRTYAKPISRGESSYKLTYEEQEAIRRAILPRTFTRRNNKKSTYS